MKKQQNSDLYSDGNNRDCFDSSKDCNSKDCGSKDCNSRKAKNCSGSAAANSKNCIRNCENKAKVESR